MIRQPRLSATAACLLLFGALIGACGNLSLGGPDWETRENGPTFDYEWTVTTLDGGETSLQDLQGKVVFLNYWATWCPPCRAEMPSIQQLHETIDHPGFEILAVSLDDSLADVTEFLDKHPEYTFPVVHARSLPEGFEFEGIPTTFLLDREGTAVLSHSGALDWAGEEPVAYIRALLNP